MEVKNVLKHFEKADPILYPYLLAVNWSEWIPDESVKSDYFTALCNSIIGQQLSTKVAATIKKRFMDNLANDEVLDPKVIISTEDQKLRDLGISWGKVSYLNDLANKHVNKEIHLNGLEELSDEEIIAELTKVKGIGPWTVEMFLIFTLGREDVFSLGDLGLKRGFEKVYSVSNPSQSKILKITKKWLPYRSFGSIALWN